MEFLRLLFQLIYFMLPAYAANMSATFGKYLFSKKVLTPIDFGVEIKGKRLFGSHKTIGGFLFGIIMALVIGHFQFLFYPHLKDLCFINYHNYWSITSLLLGAGAMTGDLVKSFFKRRLDLKPGKPWFPFDGMDFSLGALIFVSPFYFPGWWNAFIILIIGLLGHLLIDWIGFLLNIRKKRDIIDIQVYLYQLLKRIKKSHF